MSAADLRPAWQLPLQWPRATERTDAALSAERLLKAAIVFSMLALTVFDRFGLRLSAEYSIPPGMIAMYAVLAAILLGGAGALNARGALAYLVLVSVAALSFLVNTNLGPRPNVSITSLLLLFVLYAPFVVSLRPGAAPPDLRRWIARLYVGFALFLAAAGIAQFFVQFVYRPEWLFTYTPLIPDAIRGSGGWNTVNWAEDWIKSNGFFLREPSIFSIAMAFGVICELSLARRKWVIATLAAALVLTYSGSGLLCLAIAMLFPLGWGSVLRVLACAAAAAAVFFLFGEALNLGYTLERVGEVNSDKTSAYCRFIYPNLLILQNLDANAWSALLGHGPGTMPKSDAMCGNGVETTYAKALFEYGLAGALAFAALVLHALNRSAAPIRVRVALGVMWLLLGGNLLTSEFLLLILLFCAIWPEGNAKANS
jgi:hypothetical protein